jgi:carbonic anhydrase
VYDIAHAELDAFDAQQGRFVKLDLNAADLPDATPHLRFAASAA